MTLEIVQLLMSKSLLSKTKGLLSPIFLKISAPLSESSSVVLDNFVGGVETYSSLTLLLLMVGGLLIFGVSALLVVVMVQTLVISLF